MKNFRFEPPPLTFTKFYATVLKFKCCFGETAILIVQQFGKTFQIF